MSKILLAFPIDVSASILAEKLLVENYNNQGRIAMYSKNILQNVMLCYLLKGTLSFTFCMMKSPTSVTQDPFSKVCKFLCPFFLLHTFREKTKRGGRVV